MLHALKAADRRGLTGPFPNKSLSVPVTPLQEIFSSQGQTSWDRMIKIMFKFFQWLKLSLNFFYE